MTEPTPADQYGPSEHDEQLAIFEWLEFKANQNPDYGLFFAVPNGQYRPGQRLEAGVQPGVPDIMGAVPRGQYAGFFGELKVGRNKPTKDQRRWLARLAEQGYYVTVQVGADAMMREIERYVESDE